MHAWRVALAASVVVIAACQLDLAGTELVAKPDSVGPSGSTDPPDSSRDATGFVTTSDANSTQDEGMPGLVVGRSPPDAAEEATDAGENDSSDDGGALDSSAPSAVTDAGTPCARLLQCCPRLLAPPLALACIAGAMQDGGDSACETVLSSLTDAGVCP
jgi:hypothetical protein